MGHLHIHKSQCKHTHGYELSMEKDEERTAVCEQGSFLQIYSPVLLWRDKGSSLSPELR